MSNDNTVAARRIGIAPELAAGYGGQVSINTAARHAGRQYIKNVLLNLTESGPVLWYVTNGTEFRS